MQYLSDFLKRLQLSWRLFRDDRVSYAPKAIPILVMIYVVSPLDLMPFIPVDDIALIFLGLRAFEALVPDYIVYEHRAELGMELPLVDSTEQ
ncbi:MAG: hypothetical protein AAF125_02735 [Chloroflexota bacterium]